MTAAECWIAILASSFLQHLPPEIYIYSLTRSFPDTIFSNSTWFSTHSHFLTPASSPHSLTVQVFYFQSRFFPLLWIYFNSSGPSTNTFLLCHLQRPFLTLIPILTLSGQTVSARSKLPSASSLRPCALHHNRQSQKQYSYFQIPPTLQNILKMLFRESPYSQCRISMVHILGS